MLAEITIHQIGTKWHGSIAGRPDLEATGLTEDTVRRKLEELRDRVGVCGARTRMFGGRTCELIAGHRDPGEKISVVHRSGDITWWDVPPDDPRDEEDIERVA